MCNTSSISGIHLHETVYCVRARTVYRYTFLFSHLIHPVRWWWRWWLISGRYYTVFYRSTAAAWWYGIPYPTTFVNRIANGNDTSNNYVKPRRKRENKYENKWTKIHRNRTVGSNIHRIRHSFLAVQNARIYTRMYNIRTFCSYSASVYNTLRALVPLNRLRHTETNGLYDNIKILLTIIKIYI